MEVSVVVQMPASDFKIELAEMIADSFRRGGADADLIVDGDDSFMTAGAALLFGDCLGFRRSEELLRGSGSGRPETTLWQLEPFPPRLDPRWQLGARRAAAAVRWSRLQKSSLADSFRSVTPKALRSRARTSLERVLMGETSSPDAGLGVRNRNRGVRRFVRVDWIEKALRGGWLDHVVVSSPERVRLLAARNIRAMFLPVGWHPQMGTDEERERDLGAVFLGRLKRGRKPVLDRLTETLAHKGVGLTVNEGPCLGQERSRFLNRANISVNILNDVWELSRTRLTISMACGALVVSEPVADSSPFVAGRHFVAASPDEMPDAITHFLAADDERRAVVERAQALLSGPMSMAGVLQEMTSRWAASPFV